MVNYTDITFYTQQSNDPVSCDFVFQDYLDSTSDHLNFIAISFFVAYSLLMFFLQYALEKRQISLKAYVRIQRIINNGFTASAIVVFIAVLLLK